MPNERSFHNALWYSIIRLFGEYGASQANISFIEYNEEMKYAIIRCSHKALPMVQASIVAVTKVDGEDAAMYVLLVSGTLKSLRRKMLNILHGKNEREKETSSKN